MKDGGDLMRDLRAKSLRGERKEVSRMKRTVDKHFKNEDHDKDELKQC